MDAYESDVVAEDVSVLEAEGFRIRAVGPHLTTVVGADDSGVLYGCLELARRIEQEGGLPSELNFADHPAFRLRGTCVAMQKTYVLPGRKDYEYPYTPENFPFFYSKAYWIEYLDMLVANRLNMLCLWNGHPFASLVKLSDYPYALEVSESQYEANAAMYYFIAEECDRRGIWLVQNFYNILLSKPFAERHNLPTQLAAPTPVAADYTRKSIAEFVRSYPNVGLYVCLGEAMLDVEKQVDWCTNVILPGVKDGMREAGITKEPPLIIRAHATEPNVVMPAALKVYGNLYTEAKFNGESLTTWEPRGPSQETHLMLSRLGSTHIANIHILANIEPFRYGATEFIRKSALAARDRLGARGLHVYPLAYWAWPESPDACTPPLVQYERDWIWFEAWSRYAWNPDVDPADDRHHWIVRLTDFYGDRRAAESILEAYNDAGECAPRLIRRFGITEGNRQTLSLGMTLDQLVNPDNYGALPDLWLSQSPPGERLEDYIANEWEGRPHVGETPVRVIHEVLGFSQRAVERMAAAEPFVTKNRNEYERWRNDVDCIRAMSMFYAAKANAAMLVLRHRRSSDIRDLEKAAVHLRESLEHFRDLAALTESRYRFANSMQTGHRRIPVAGAVDGQPAFFHWVQLVPVYERELAEFMTTVEQTRAAATPLPE